VVIKITLGDLVTSILAGCLRISTIVASDTLGVVELTRVSQCPILWLPVGILCGA
jgi:hypothetical protein